MTTKKINSEWNHKTGCTPLLMTNFLEKKHNIWERGEAQGRLLLVIVGWYAQLICVGA